MRFPDLKWPLWQDLRKKYPRASVYLVGGMVRDILLGRKCKDFDFVACGVPAKDLQAFLGQRGSVDLVGRAFGVFKFKPTDAKTVGNIKLSKQDFIDIALPRTEISTGPHYRDFKVVSDEELGIEEDLSRRDFAVNAMAFDIFAKEVIDPYQGHKNLEKKTIKAVGDPAKRFDEDLLRVFRGMRFACQLGFKIDPKTEKAMRKKVKERGEDLLSGENIAREVLAQELLKSLLANPRRTLILYDAVGALVFLIPELTVLKGLDQPKQHHTEGDVWEHTLLAAAAAPKSASLTLILAAIFHDLGKKDTITEPTIGEIHFYGHEKISVEKALNIINRLKLEVAPRESALGIDKKEIAWLINNHMLFWTADLKTMRPATIYKYFLKNKKWGDDLQQLFKIDSEATHSTDEADEARRWRILQKKTRELKKDLAREKQTDKLDIIDGETIMRELNLKPGPAVGKALNRARDFAVNFLSENKKKPTQQEVLTYLRQ